MGPPGPFPPQYDAHQIATIQTDEIEKQRAPATPATWVIALLLAAATIAWVVTVVLNTRG